MGDREADIYELFDLALQDPKGPKLLVRAEQDRLLADGQGHLWPVVASQPEAGIQEIHVPRRRINEIVLGKRDITADTDLRLARYFGLSEGFFLGLQMDFDLMQRRREIDRDLKAIRPRAA